MAHYCQSCGAKTILKFADGRYREVCPDCGTISYLQWKVSAGVRVVKDGGLLLVKRGHEPYRDTWHMPAEVGFFSPEEAAMLPLAGMSAEKELSDWLEMIRES